MVESSRRHGHFDGRYPVLPKHVARTGVPVADADGVQLDWSAFLGRFFPRSRRRDGVALAAYDAYKHWLVLRKEAA